MSGQRSKPAERVVRVLETLRARPGEGLRFADLARATGLSQATCHSILLTLADAGWVVRDPAERTYTLGPALVALGASARAAFPEIRAVRAQLEQLAATTDLAVSAARVVDGVILVVDIVGRDRETLPIREGTRVPFAPPFGAIHAAWEPPSAVDAWIARAPGHSFTAERLRAVVDDHRRTHVAVAPYTQSSARLREALGELAVDALARDVRDRTLELLAAIDELDYTSDVLARADRLPVNTLTAPVFDQDARVSFAVALHLAAPDLPVARVQELAGLLRTAAEAMTHALGGRLPEPTSPTATTPDGVVALVGGSR